MSCFSVYYPECTDIGQKATNLLVLDQIAAGFVVPCGFVLPRENTPVPNYTPWQQRWPLLAMKVGLELGPRLVVRSSPLVSMPGMLTTVVDIPNEIGALDAAITEVLDSWNSPQAVAFRKLYRISDEHAMGVIIQDYVAPAPGSWAGVYFTRNPRTGSAEGVIEALEATTGSELVSGRQTPEQPLPAAYAQRLRHLQPLLEKTFGGPLDVEFVFKDDVLYLVQARLLRHIDAPAAAYIAADMLRENILSADQLGTILDPRDSRAPWWLSVDSPDAPHTRGMGAVSGAVTGKICFGPTPAESGPDWIFVDEYTDAEQIPAMLTCSGILTSTGGQTSHAAIIAMGAGIPAVVGARFSIRTLEDETKVLVLGDGQQLAQGELLTLDGSTGAVYLGAVPIIDRRQSAFTPSI